MFRDYDCGNILLVVIPHTFYLDASKSKVWMSQNSRLGSDHKLAQYIEEKIVDDGDSPEAALPMGGPYFPYAGRDNGKRGGDIRPAGKEAGAESFRRIFQTVAVDNGSEFQDWEGMMRAATGGESRREQTSPG